jgi:hypothetical protein
MTGGLLTRPIPLPINYSVLFRRSVDFYANCAHNPILTGINPGANNLFIQHKKKINRPYHKNKNRHSSANRNKNSKKHGFIRI